MLSYRVFPHCIHESEGGKKEEEMFFVIFL